MVKQVPLNWTPKQKKVLGLLQAGHKSSDIQKLLKVNGTAVLKVKNAIAMGDTPDHPLSKTIVKEEVVPKVVVLPKQEAGVVGEKTETGTSADKKTTEVTKPTINPLVAGDTEIEAKLYTTPILIPITQIMVNARAYLVQALNWPGETRWQDIIDTIFYKYFKSLNPPVILQGWYIGDPLKPAKGNGEEKKGNGHNPEDLDLDSPGFKHLANLVTQQILELAKAGKLGG